MFNKLFRVNYYKILHKLLSPKILAPKTNQNINYHQHR